MTKIEEYPLPDKILRVNDVTFRCECGCNVFREHFIVKGKYKCNSCGVIYKGK